MKNKIENSEAIKRVWKWKDDIYNDVKELNINDRFKKIHEMAQEIESKKEDFVKL